MVLDGLHREDTYSISSLDSIGFMGRSQDYLKPWEPQQNLNDSYVDNSPCFVFEYISDSGISLSIKADQSNTVGQIGILLFVNYLFQTNIQGSYYNSKASSLSWAEKVIEFSDCGMDDDALKEISEITTKLKNSCNKKKISEGMSWLLNREPSDIVSIALLRNTFSFRSEISCWSDFLAATERRLEVSGKEPSRFLRGLKQ